MDLYREDILDHYKNPHNFNDLPDKTHSAREMNASCGDMVEIYLKIEKGVVIEAAFRGVGCALSTAAASMLTDKIKGMKVDEVAKMGEMTIKEMMGEVNPGRIKCVMLPLVVLKKTLGV
jgi:nitrogen fixation NifU-like protein